MNQDTNPFSVLKELKKSLVPEERKQKGKLSPYTRKIQKLQPMVVTEMTSEYFLKKGILPIEEKWIEEIDEMNVLDILTSTHEDLALEELTFKRRIAEEVIGNLYPLLSMKIRHFSKTLKKLSDPRLDPYSRWTGIKEGYPRLYSLFYQYLDRVVSLRTSRNKRAVMSVQHHVIKMSVQMLDNVVAKAKCFDRKELTQFLLNKVDEDKRPTIEPGNWIDIYPDEKGMYTPIGVIINTSDNAYIEKYKPIGQKKTRSNDNRVLTQRNIVK